ncbi:nicotinate-nucleotide--dimethylbenzimidazole phosphoribosyltransferase [Kineococcus xinjiangensis]|uniref:Nicotinate-nucleotide--dimethylbenzimidazole phosphoribosyltransferase n=1 Tax=Kineococcus xinjiangensis TaxID=512762 RepID=A0A2S6IM59_9ACTN|nr:nicotinate-nucleotide--dimethylbenzimidazole phosphoribosyltransferase [Kineococcus xinjiangensis]PPK95323.1 nicotinate-nucleotide--dimethylbenzimidazole phosphoribosyltransferase [Kineococcus xinjiangensis]
MSEQDSPTTATAAGAEAERGAHGALHDVGHNAWHDAQLDAGEDDARHDADDASGGADSGGLDLRRLGTAVAVPDRAAAAAAEESLAALAARHGGIGRLGELASWLAAVRGPDAHRPLERIRLVVLAADAGMAAVGLSRHPAGWTAEEVRALHTGTAPAAVLAREAGVGLRVLDVGVDADLGDLPPEVTAWKVRPGSGDARTGDALTLEQAAAAFRAGATAVDEEVDAGADLLLLGETGVGGSAVAAVVVGACLRNGPLEVLGRDVGLLDDATWMRRTAAVRDALRRSRPVAHDPLALLAAVGGTAAAAATGFLVQAAVRRTPVLLDGLGPVAAGLVAIRISLTAKEWWRVGSRSAQPAQALALNRLGSEPLTDLGVAAGSGVGALAALPLVRAGHALLQAAATDPLSGTFDGSAAG